MNYKIVDDTPVSCIDTEGEPIEIMNSVDILKCYKRNMKLFHCVCDSMGMPIDNMAVACKFDNLILIEYLLLGYDFDDLFIEVYDHEVEAGLYDEYISHKGKFYVTRISN